MAAMPVPGMAAEPEGARDIERPAENAGAETGGARGGLPRRARETYSFRDGRPRGRTPNHGIAKKA